MQQPRLPALIGGAAVLALLSLLLAFEPVFDPWAWLIWGRELAALELDTSAGSSWKPLPVAVTALGSVSNDGAADVWLAVSRFGWLLSAGIAWRLAARLAEGPAQVRFVAGLVAAGSLLLIADPFTPWFRQFSGGLSEPLLAALILLAIDRDLEARRGAALASGFAATLIRPEAWPFFWAYAAIVSRRRPRLRGRALILSVLVLVLWFIPDVLGAGNPFEGAMRARQGTGAPVGAALEALGRAAAMPLAGLWPFAIGFAWVAARAGRRVPILLLAATGAWIALVAIGAAVGYAGLPRFIVPAAAMVCVLGGAGVGRGLGAVSEQSRGSVRTVPKRLALLVALAAAVIGVQALERATRIPADVRDASAFSRSVGDLFSAADAAGRLPARCGEVDVSDLTVQAALAWKLERPLGGVGVRVRSAPERGTAFVDRADGAAVRAAEARGRAVVGVGAWTVYAITCDAPLPP